MSTQPITLIEAITQALAWEIQHDDSVVVLGEDVGVNGGVFRATAGLSSRFGAKRILDTPLDETTIAGLTVGMASQGMKPVAEAQFDGFMYPMVDFIVCHAARMRYRTRGRLSCPMVLRVPWGGGIRAPEPLSTFISPTGTAGRKSVGSPSAATAAPMAPISRSISPAARNTAIATSIATRYGMMPTATPKPSFAPSTKASYTFTRRTAPATRKTATMAMMKPAPINPIHCAA